MIGRKRKKQFLVLSIVLAVIFTGIAGCARKPQDDATLAAFCPNGENHEFDMEITQADCTQRGYTIGNCQKCGYTYMYDMVNALGHQWGAPVSVKPASCTEDGLQNISCSRCGITQEEPLAHSGHSYTLAAAEGAEEQETVEYVCTVCGDVITRNWDEPLVEELKEKTFLPDRSADFAFLVRCDQGEDYLRNNLTLTGENGAVSYDITVEENGIYRISATEPYEQYQTYQVRLAEDMLFPEYNAKALDFSIIGPDRAEVEFNDDNLIFLKKLELREYGKSGLYELQWDEAAQRYYLTLFELRDIKPSMIGKVIGIGDYTSTAEILADSTRELCFAKLEKISHNAEGDLLLELSVPQLSEVYDKLDIYFTGNAEQMRISGDPEQAFMNAVVNSEGFAEYLTATHLAAESYASTYGLVVTPLAETSRDDLKFELTKSSLKKAETDNACLLELGGKITYTIPLKSKAGHASGSIVMTCNAEITARISAGGHFNDKDSVDLHLTNETTTTLSFNMVFNLEYSQSSEETYLLHKNTQKIHTSTCRIANKETDSANLQRLTAQQLSEWYHGDRDVMKQHECKVCLAVTGLDGTAYAYNKNTGVLHCMNCRHVTNIKDYNLYTLHPANTLTFTNCADCQPEKRQAKDFDNRMLNAIRGSDWAEQVSSFQNMLGDSIGKKKPAEETEPILSVTINIAGIFNIEIGVAPVFEFDMEASVNFTITGNTSNTYGIHNVGEGFETYHDEQPGKVDYDLSFAGEADAKFGISLIVEAYPVGLDKAAYISLNGQVGLYGHFTGIFAVEGTVGGDTDAYCAARLEVGLYARVDGYWKILWFDNSFEIIKEKRIRLFKWGYDRMYYAFEEEEIEWTVENPDEFVTFNLPLLMKAKYLDLTTMEYKTGNISPISKSHLNGTVEIKNEDGSPCDYLEYIPQNGMIHKKDNAPESFTAVITVRVTPKVQIESLREFFDSETKELRYGYSMDPLVVKIKVNNFGNLVTEAFAEVCTYKAKMYNYETGKSEETEIICTFRIPQINLPSQVAEQINEEIYNALYPVAEDAVEEISEYGRPFSSEEISYRWAVNDNILSLVILNSSAPDFGGGNEYMVYNIDISTGEKVSAVSLIQTAGFSEEKYYEKARQVLGSSFWSNWDPSDENFGNQSFVDFFNEQLKRTVSDDNIAQSHPYINEKGQLCIIAKKYSLAAADYYWHDLNMIEFVLSPYYASEAGKITHAIKITEEEAYQIACEYWNYSEGDVSPETGFEMYVVPEYGEALKEDSKTGKYYYCYLLRWLVVDENGDSWMSTCDIVHIDAETGECTYFS